MKLGIMQPYFFPYIGYYQLINAVDKYIILDDVNFIKGGWINRNRILIHKEPKYINQKAIIDNSNFYSYSWIGTAHVPVKYYGKPNPALK